MKRGKKSYMVQQHDRSDCGAACLVSVCSYYGRHLPLITVRNLCGTTESGSTLRGLVDAAAALGLAATPLKAVEKNWQALSSVEVPAVVHLRKDDGWLHFAVMYRWTRSYVLLMDPEEGRMVRMGERDFIRQWSGYVVRLTPSDGFIKEDRRIRIWHRFAGMLRTNLGDILMALAGAAVYILMGLSVSLYLQRIVDDALGAGDMDIVTVSAVSLAVMLVVMLTVGYLRTMYVVKVSLKMDRHLVLGYLGRLICLPVRFFTGRSTGELNSRIKDAYRIRSFVAVRLMMMCICIGTLSVCLAMMFSFCSRLALMVLLYIPLYAVLYKVSDTVNRRINRKVIERSASLDALNVETIAGVRTIRYFGWEDIFYKRIGAEYDAFLKENYRSGRCTAAFAVSSEWIGRLMTFTILIVGVFLVREGALTTGELVSFFSMVTFFTSPVVSLIESNDEVTQAEIAAERLFEVTDLSAEESAGRGIPVPSEPCDIVLENVSFAYPGGRRIMDDVSLTLHRGAVNAVSGANGCGKSTLAMMLMGGFRPDSGRITAGGDDINDFSLKEWRRYVSIVPQVPELFRGSVLYNICPDVEEPDYALILSLCREVGLDMSLSRWTDGILTEVGEGGCRLSGGERQKVALLRALYRDPRILVMDEATSSLDETSRDLVLSHIRKMADSGKNIIMITHDECCLTAADCIIDANQLIKKPFNNQLS